MSLTGARAPLTSSLVERECAVVAFKHWRFGTFGRPVAHDACVVVAWKHWRFLFVRVAKERDAKAERFREALSKRRFLKIKWEDETANRANRRAYDLEERRRRLDRLYGLDPESKYGSAARASASTIMFARMVCVRRGKMLGFLLGTGTRKKFRHDPIIHMDGWILAVHKKIVCVFFATYVGQKGVD